MKFHILIPVYNDQDGLNNLLNEIQERNEHTITVVDDGSHPPIYASHNNVEIIRLQNNSGIVAALNFGLNHIEAQYGNNCIVARLDCGDVPSENTFSDRLHYFQNKRIKIVGCYCEFIDKTKPSNNFIWKNQLKKPSNRFPLKTNYIHSGVMYITDGLRYQPQYYHCEDVFMFARIEAAAEGRIDPKIGMQIFQNDLGISTLKRKEQLVSLRNNIFRSYIKVKPFQAIARIVYITALLSFSVGKGLEISLKKALRG